MHGLEEYVFERDLSESLIIVTACYGPARTIRDSFMGLGCGMPAAH